MSCVASVMRAHMSAGAPCWLQASYPQPGVKNVPSDYAERSRLRTGHRESALSVLAFSADIETLCASVYPRSVSTFVSRKYDGRAGPDA